MIQIESFVNDQNASRELGVLPPLELVSAAPPASCFFAYGATAAVTAWLVTKARGGFDETAPVESQGGVPSDMSGDQLIGLVRDLNS